jgi:hypothetical protein
MLLSSYLNGLYDFGSVDARLSVEGFVPAEEGDYYLRRSLLGSRYFYLRNNIHVERLTVEQISYLKGERAADDAQGLQIVEETCEEVVAVRLSFAQNDEYLTSYHNNSRGDQLTPNTALVFFVDYQNTQADTEEYWLAREQEALLIDEISREIAAALQPSFKVEIVFLNQEWSLPQGGAD